MTSDSTYQASCILLHPVTVIAKEEIIEEMVADIDEELCGHPAYKCRVFSAPRLVPQGFWASRSRGLLLGYFRS